jgi:NAD(P)-dependent dehydrogenase (short-subunit alcohol dehydrogenase family)
MGRLSGKVAIITGAASGMGLAGAKLFVREGAKVVATDVVADKLEKQIADIQGDIIALPLDVSSEEQWKRVVDETVEHYGKVDVLVNNAGVLFGTGLLEHTLESWNKLLSINLTGVWLGMREVIPHMQAIGGGSIVNCSSIAGEIGGADGGDAAYTASKGAVRLLTKTAALTFAKDNIRINSVHPGAIVTGMTEGWGATQEELGKSFQAETPLPPHAGEPFDIAYGYLYLASDESKFVTGAELVIDGGWISH